MAVGKTLKKSFYADSGSGSKDIAMPPIDGVDQSNPSGDKSFMNVPEELPQEVYKEMSEQEKTNQEVEEVVETEQVEQQVVEEQETTEEVETEVAKESTEEVKPSPQESFKSIREAKEKAERERDMVFQQMLEYQKQKEASVKQSKKPDAPPVDDDIDFNLDEDGLVEGRYVKKVTNKIKNLEKQLQSYQNQSNQTVIESRIKQEFPDFEKVVSTQNVEMLNSQFPEVARTLKDNSDLYSQAVSAYNVIKKFGIHRDDPHQEDRIKALKNTQKPRTVTSVNPQQGDSPLSKANAFANGLTEDLKDQLRREMVAARKAM